MTDRADEKPIDPASPRERLRAWLNWLPAWFLIPMGLGAGQDVNAADLPPDFHPGGYGGPLDHPGGGDFGGGMDGGGGMGGF